MAAATGKCRVAALWLPPAVADQALLHNAQFVTIRPIPVAFTIGVSVVTIFKIIRSKMWRFTATANAPQSRKPRNHMSRLTKKARVNIESMLATLAVLGPENPEVRALIRLYEITAHANAVP
ncbi:hypothetical protein [Yoonia sp.]|uniref:hypothetical protein n=1 Tax=Yoonia sp. TaxID=2212373 RepID=UPI002E035FF2|nr:hypothetical protein [Yoonia sp.]